MALAADTSGWLCLVFANPSSLGSQVCKEEYTMSKNAADIGDYFEIHLASILDQTVV